MHVGITSHTYSLYFKRSNGGVLPSGRHYDVRWLRGNLCHSNTPSFRTHKKGIFSSWARRQGSSFVAFLHTQQKSKSHPLTMPNAPKAVKRSHSKQRRKVNDGPLPIRTPCESLAANVNVVTQPTQECHHDDDEIAASTLLALSSSPGRPPGSSSATPFQWMVPTLLTSLVRNSFVWRQRRAMLLC